MRTLLLLIVLFTSHAYTKETKLPNVLLIFVDDLGYCDTELYGCDNVPTPNIKRLADEGVLFTIAMSLAQFVLNLEQVSLPVAISSDLGTNIFRGQKMGSPSMK